MQGVWVQPLVRELRSHMPCGVAQKFLKKKKRKEKRRAKKNKTDSLPSWVPLSRASRPPFPQRSLEPKSQRKDLEHRLCGDSAGHRLGLVWAWISLLGAPGGVLGTHTLMKPQMGQRCGSPGGPSERLSPVPFSTVSSFHGRDSNHALRGSLFFLSRESVFIQLLREWKSL